MRHTSIGKAELESIKAKLKEVANCAHCSIAQNTKALYILKKHGVSENDSRIVEIWKEIGENQRNLRRAEG